MRSLRVAFLSLVFALWGSGPAAAAAPPGAGTFSWPVEGPVLQVFDAPDSPYGSGHRGVDIAAPVGTPIRVPAPATVRFAGEVAGSLFVTLDHGTGVETTYSWLSDISVREGERVSEGTALAFSGTGHPGATVPHLHLGARWSGEYIDPLLLLTPMAIGDLIRLAPLPGSCSGPLGPCLQ